MRRNLALLRYIFGKPGTGKTFTCAKEIRLAQDENHGRALIYVVPEQFSLSSERVLLDNPEGRGLFSAQVLSFNRLAYSVLREVGRGGLLPLDDMGKHILIRKALTALTAVENGLVYYKSGQSFKGFVEKIGQLITEFYQYGVRPEALLEAAGKGEEDSAYSLRLRDLGNIFAAYLALVQERYNTGDSTLDMLAERVFESKMLRGAELWIDGFKSFTPQEYKVLAAIFSVCERVNIALPMDFGGRQEQFGGFFEQINFYEPFAEVKTTVNKLTRLALENKASLGEHVFLEENQRHISFPALAGLLDNYFGRDILSSGHEGIYLTRHRDIHGELDYAARRVTELVRDFGYRYSDIGIAASDLGLYSGPMSIVFARHGISFFVDERRNLLAHPLAEVCRGALGVAKGRFVYENLFRALKTGLLAMDKEEVDILENYVLACGIKSWGWEQEWKWNFEGAELVNSLRLRVLEAFESLRGFTAKGRYGAKDLCAALYEFLNRGGVKERLAEWIEKAKSPESPDELEKAQVHTQVWLRLVEILDITVELFGDEAMTLADFILLLEAGFESVSAGVAPPSLDHIIAGDVRRSRLAEVKALFVLGLNESMIPARKEEGLIPDSDREVLKAAGVELAGTLKSRALEERLNIYIILAKPLERLYMSYLAEETSGPPSPFLKDILAKVPGLEAINPSPTEITGANAMLYTIWENLREPGDMAGDLRETYDILRKNKSMGPLMRRFENLSKNRHSLEERLTDENLTALYGLSKKHRISTTVSKLESYRQCPFMHFARDCLELKSRKLYEVESHDVGSILHLVLERFTKTLKDRGAGLKGEELREVVSDIVEKAAEECANAIFLGGQRYIHYKDRIKATALSSAKAMAAHLARGDFSVHLSEAAFGKDRPLSFDLGDRVIELTGRIDRVDMLDREDRRLLSVIDYKTGSRDFSFADIWLGVQLQLAIYLMGALAENPGAEPAGIMYFKVANPVVDYYRGLEDPAAEVFEKYRLSGVISSDLNVILSMDKEAVRGDVLPVKLTAGGAEISKRSLVLDKAGFEALIETAAGWVKELGRGILSGEIPANPLKHKSRLPCAYCDYKALCGREAGENPRQTPKINEGEAYNLILGAGNET